jgi:hypothetical protein
MEQSPSWKSDSRSAGQEIPLICGTRRSITVFTKSLNWMLLWAVWVQSKPSHPVPLTSIPMSSSTCTSVCYLASHFHIFHQNFIQISQRSHACYMPCPSHYFLYDQLKIVIFGERVPRNYEASHFVIFSSLLLIPPSYVQIFLAPCSQTPSICFYPICERSTFTWI